MLSVSSDGLGLCRGGRQQKATIRQHPPADVSRRQQTSADVSIHQHVAKEDGYGGKVDREYPER